MEAPYYRNEAHDRGTFLVGGPRGEGFLSGCVGARQDVAQDGNYKWEMAPIYIVRRGKENVTTEQEGSERKTN